jgi:hypothetical protein
MKNRLLLFLLIIFSRELIIAQTYTPFHLDIGTSWVTQGYNSSGTGTTGYLDVKSTVVSDTVISSFHYYIITSIRKHSGFNMITYKLPDTTFLRNDTANKKVYAYINNSDSLIYDFDKQIGDTLFPTLPGNFSVVVDTIGMITYYGIQYKFYGQKPITTDQILIEGLGTKFGFVLHAYSPGFESGYFTKCIKYQGQALYGDSSNTCDVITGVLEYSNQDNILIYPNPSKDYLQFNIPFVSNNVNVSVYSIIGSLLGTYNKINLNSRIDISPLDKGTYIIELEIDGRNYYNKFVKE